jgi:hypothetical protein
MSIERTRVGRNLDGVLLAVEDALHLGVAGVVRGGHLLLGDAAALRETNQDLRQQPTTDIALEEDVTERVGFLQPLHGIVLLPHGLSLVLGDLALREKLLDFGGQLQTAILERADPVDGYQCDVAQVPRDDDRRIQRREIERDDAICVVALLGFDHDGAAVALGPSLRAGVRVLLRVKVSRLVRKNPLFGAGEVANLP